MAFAIALFDDPQARQELAAKWLSACQEVYGAGARQELIDDDRLCATVGEDGSLVRHGDGCLVISGRLDGAGAATLTGEESASRTELVESWARDGGKRLSRMAGSYSLAMYDQAAGRLGLARDRFGTRPLFYLRQPSATFVSTDLAPLVRMSPALEVDPGALLLHVRFRFNVSHQHLLSSIRQVQSATMVSLDRQGGEVAERYWEIPFDPASNGSLDEWVRKTHQAFHEFFDTEGLTGEPAGILLSGGVDSAVIAGAARECCSSVIGYVARFGEGEAEEARRAVAVADHLGIPCHVIDFDESRIEGDLRRVVSALGEPPLHQNNLALLQLYERAARDVGTVLQGDAAEMLFGLADSRRVPQFARKRLLAERVLPRAPRAWASRLLKRGDSSQAWRVARILGTDVSDWALGLDGIDYTPPVRRVAEGAWEEAGSPFPYAELLEAYPDFDDGLQAYQARTSLQASLDRHYRLSSLCGVRSIAPFVSEPLVGVACRLPRSLRFLDTSRPVVKALCDRIAHPDVSGWKKRGFEVPWRDRWLHGPLAGLLGGPTDYDGVREVLPPGFCDEAWRTLDPEALWLLMTLRISVREALA